MLRNIRIGFLCASALISANSYAMNHELKAHTNIVYEFPAKKPLLFINIMFYTITAVCTIETPEKNVSIRIKGIYRSGEVNDSPLNAGESMDVPVVNGTVLKLVAKPAAQVEMTNLGNEPLKAYCTT